MHDACALTRAHLLRRSYTRQCMVNRGLLPFLATPAAGETLLEDAVRHAAHLRLVKAHDHVVVVSAEGRKRSTACAAAGACGHDAGVDGAGAGGHVLVHGRGQQRGAVLGCSSAYEGGQEGD